MNRHFFWQRTISVLLATILALPLQAAAAEADAARYATGPISDQALEATGVLSGRVLDAEGRPLSGVRVRLRFERALVAEAMTDGAGQFELRSPRGGVHTIEVAGAVQVLRLWTRDAAPPAARREPLSFVVSWSRLPAVRGQSPDPTVVGGQGPWLTPYRGTWIVLGALAGLIVAVNADNDDAS